MVVRVKASLLAVDSMEGGIELVKQYSGAGGRK